MSINQSKRLNALHCIQTSFRLKRSEMEKSNSFYINSSITIEVTNIIILTSKRVPRMRDSFIITIVN